MYTHLFAQPASVAVGGEGEETDPEVGPAIGLAREEFDHQLTDRRKVADKGHAGDKADQQPQAVLGEFAQELVAAHGGFVELHALVAVTLGDLFAPHENPGPHALRAGVATPHPAGEHSDEEQAEGGDDENAREQDEVLRPDGGAEDVELAFGQVPPHGLVPSPVQPHGAEVQQEQCGTPTMRRRRNRPVKARV